VVLPELFTVNAICASTATLILAGIGLLAIYVPTRRARRVDSVTAFRRE
jgi:ABC-type antimicrobial peptide transport system permease subunit